MTTLVTKKGDVWVGGESSKGAKDKEVKRPSLLYLDKQQGKLIPFENQVTKALNLQNRNISDIREGANGTIWVATNDGDLVAINRETGKTQSFSLNAKGSLKKRQIRQIL